MGNLLLQCEKLIFKIFIQIRASQTGHMDQLGSACKLCDCHLGPTLLAVFHHTENTGSCGQRGHV